MLEESKNEEQTQFHGEMQSGTCLLDSQMSQASQKLPRFGGKKKGKKLINQDKKLSTSAITLTKKVVDKSPKLAPTLIVN